MSFGNKPRKPLAQVGRRAKREMAAREAMRETVIAETGGRCVAASLLPGNCWGGLDVHELISRATRPGVQLDAEFAVSICHPHHMVITEDEELARSLRLSFYSYEVTEARERAAELKASVWR